MSLRDFYSDKAIRAHVAMLRQLAAVMPDECEHLLGTLDDEFTKQIDAMKAGRRTFAPVDPHRAVGEKLARIRAKSPAAARCLEAMLNGAIEALYPEDSKKGGGDD